MGCKNWTHLCYHSRLECGLAGVAETGSRGLLLPMRLPWAKS